MGQCYGDYYDNIPNYFDYDDPDHGGLLDDYDDYDDDGPLRLRDFDELVLVRSAWPGWLWGILYISRRCRCGAILE